MPDIEIHVDLGGHVRRVGLARLNKVRGTETITFEYGDGWLTDPDCFSIEPALTLTRGTFPPPPGQSFFGSIGDSAPDTWGRRLMQRAERRQASHEHRAVRTLTESDYLLGVSDETRLAQPNRKPLPKRICFSSRSGGSTTYPNSTCERETRDTSAAVRLLSAND
jgi:serine/threonine-protein kinase HipA